MDNFRNHPNYNDDYETGRARATTDWANYDRESLANFAAQVLDRQEEALLPPIPPFIMGWVDQIIKLGSKPDKPKEFPVESHGMCPFRRWIDRKLSAYYCNLKSDYCESTNDILGLQLGDSCPLTEQGVLVKRG